MPNHGLCSGGGHGIFGVRVKILKHKPTLLAKLTVFYSDPKYALAIIPAKACAGWSVGCCLMFAPITCSNREDCTTIVQSVVPERVNGYDCRTVKQISEND